MHVCYLSHTADIRGGGERSLLELMRHVERDLGHRTSLISPPGPLVAEAAHMTNADHEALDFTILRRTRNPLRLVSYGGRYVSSVTRLRRILRRLRPDLLHANSAPAALYGGLAALGTGIPVVWHMRDIQPPAPTFRLVLPLIGRLASRVVAISGAVKENLEGFGIPGEKISVVYNAVRPPTLEGGEELRRDLGLEPDHLVLSVIGQMLHRKGQLTAVRAFGRVASEIPEARLLLCGGNLESEYGRRVAEAVEDLALDDRTVFTGFLRDPGPVFHATDVLIVPSNQEPFGRVVVEAMFSGNPVVATQVGGIPELIRDGVDGVLVPRGDDRAMAAAVVRLASTPGLIGDLGRNARKRAAESFSWERRATDGALSRLYEDVTASSIPDR